MCDDDDDPLHLAGVEENLALITTNRMKTYNATQAHALTIR